MGPVLQIDLDKKNNSIIISGLFYRDNSYLLMPRNSPIVVVNYPTRFLRLSEIEKNRYLDESIQAAKKLLIPLHPDQIPN